MLDKHDIQSYLKQINDELAASDERGEIILCGGAVMTVIYESREITKDIDAAFSPASLIRNIASKIAANDGLDSDWLNDGAKGFLDTRLLTIETVTEFSNLTVKAPDAEGMLALKLASARLRTKDEADALFLMDYLEIRNMEQIFDILEKNIHPSMLTAKVSFFAQDIFQKFQETKQFSHPDMVIQTSLDDKKQECIRVSQAQDAMRTDKPKNIDHNIAK